MAFYSLFVSQHNLTVKVHSLYTPLGIYVFQIKWVLYRNTARPFPTK